eukprot:556556-Hanusia_phi.AAC.3
MLEIPSRYMRQTIIPHSCAHNPPGLFRDLRSCSFICRSSFVVSHVWHVPRKRQLSLLFLARSRRSTHLCDLICYLTSSSDQPFFIDQTPLPGALLTVAVDQTLVFRIMAASVIQGDLEISILADPGAPMGSQLSVTEKIEYLGVYHRLGYSRNFSFSPSTGQEGQLYSICFQARMIQSASTTASKIQCVRIEVLSARARWFVTGLCNPADFAVGCFQEQYQPATVGCSMSYAVYAVARQYSLLLRIAQYPSCPDCVGTGVGVQACTANMSSSCCGNNICEGAEMGSNCPSDCPPDDLNFQQTVFGSEVNQFTSEAELTWTPTRGMEGRLLLLCIEAVDALQRRPPGGPGPGSFCITYDIERCNYCVPQGLTLAQMASQFQLTMDWVYLYNSNTQFLSTGPWDPEIVYPRDKVNVGPRYQVMQGDSLPSIAGEGKTHLKDR